MRQIQKDFNEHEIYKNRIRKMTPLNTLKIRGLDNETSRCISNVSYNNKISNQSFSEKSIIKKTEDVSIDSKPRNYNGNRSLIPITHIKKKEGGNLGDFILESNPTNKQMKANKNKKNQNDSSVLKPKLDEIEIKGSNILISPKNGN